MRPHAIDFVTLDQAVQRLAGQVVLRYSVADPRAPIFTLWLGPTPATASAPEPWGLNVHCAWRTTEADTILCSWQEAIEGDTAPALQALVGLQIGAVALSVFGDLLLTFTSGRALHIWNDAPYEEGDSWLLSVASQGEYAVAMRNAFTYCPANLHRI